MPSSKRTIPGMDTPQHVRDWFVAKGHPYLVFNVADVLEMVEDDQRLFLDIMARAGVGYAPPHITQHTPWGATSVPIHTPPAPDLRGHIQRAGTRGYALVDISRLCEVTIEELQAVQALCVAYRDVRQGKLEPSIKSPCDCTKGNRLDRGCPNCGGRGYVRVLLEMSEIEAALASGKTWEEIDKEGIS